MQYRQKPDESNDDFVTRARTLVQNIQVTDEELNECAIIATTRDDAERNTCTANPKAIL